MGWDNFFGCSYGNEVVCVSACPVLTFKWSDTPDSRAVVPKILRCYWFCETICWAEVESPKTAWLACSCQGCRSLAHNAPSHSCWDPQVPQDKLPESCSLLLAHCLQWYWCSPTQFSATFLKIHAGWINFWVYLNVCPYVGNPLNMQT